MGAGQKGRNSFYLAKSFLIKILGFAPEGFVFVAVAMVGKVEAAFSGMFHNSPDMAELFVRGMIPGDPVVQDDAKVLAFEGSSVHDFEEGVKRVVACRFK